MTIITDYLHQTPFFLFSGAALATTAFAVAINASIDAFIEAILVVDLFLVLVWAVE
jgi:hypothetical protein